MGPVVTEEEVAPEWNHGARVAHSISAPRLDVGLRYLFAVDEDHPSALTPVLERESDHALDEEPAGAATLPGRSRSLENHDVAAHGSRVSIRDGVDEVALLCQAARSRLRTVQRRLHRGGGHPVDVPCSVSAADNEEKCRKRRGPTLQWNEMRVGGQYVANTGPTRFFRGTSPQRRESQEELRLSPIIR